MRSVSLLYLSQEDILSLRLSDEQILEALYRGLVSHGQRKVQMPPKPGLFPRRGSYSYFHAMPAYVEDLDICGLKWLGRASENPQLRDLPQFTGLQILSDPESGVPLCVMDCRWITVVRTAGISVLTARYCANPQPKNLAILGTGLQGRFHALMLTKEFPSIENIYLYNRSQEGLNRFISDMKHRLKANLIPLSAKEAVEHGEIVVSSGVMEQTIHLDWIQPGALCLGLDLAKAWFPDVITRVDRILTDDEKQFWDRYKIEPEAFSGKPEVKGELGQIVIGALSGRTSPQEKILSLNVGIALSDLVLGNLIYQEAKRHGAGTRLPLMEQENILPV